MTNPITAPYADEPVVVIPEDDICREFLLHEGLLHKLVPPAGANFAAHLWYTDTHWYLAMFHTGHRRAEDNGYLIHLLSRKEFTRAEAAIVFTETLQASGMDTDTISFEEFNLQESIAAN